MFSFLSNYLENTSLTDVIILYWNAAILYLTDFLNCFREVQEVTVKNLVDKIPYSIQFDDFQWNLLKIFSGLLLFNLISIAIVWKVYGKILCSRFVKNSTLREIEELKASVAKLKLPKEHTPRI